MSDEIVPDAELDCIGLYCPAPVLETNGAIEEIEVGQVLKVEADDPASEEDIARWAKRTGNELLKFKKEEGVMTFWIKRKK